MKRCSIAGRVVARILRDDQGQDLAEYGLLAALIVVVAIASVTLVGNTINDVFWESIAQNF